MIIILPPFRDSQIQIHLLLPLSAVLFSPSPPLPSTLIFPFRIAFLLNFPSLLSNTTKWCDTAVHPLTLLQGHLSSSNFQCHPLDATISPPGPPPMPFTQYQLSSVTPSMTSHLHCSIIATSTNLLPTPLLHFSNAISSSSPSMPSYLL